MLQKFVSYLHRRRYSHLLNVITSVYDWKQDTPNSLKISTAETSGLLLACILIDSPYFAVNNSGYLYGNLPFVDTQNMQEVISFRFSFKYVVLVNSEQKYILLQQNIMKRVNGPS